VSSPISLYSQQHGFAREVNFAPQPHQIQDFPGSGGRIQRSKPVIEITHACVDGNAMLEATIPRQAAHA
jgi:hypothetical protein